MFISLLLLLTSCMSSDKQEDKFFTDLPGTWLMKMGEMEVGETWTRDHQESFKGTSFFIKNKDTTVYEYVVLEKKDQQWSYTVRAAGQNKEQPISFRLTHQQDRTFTFENPAHDFPKRIIYRFFGQDSIHASIDAGEQMKEKEEHFYYRRQAMK